MTGKSKEVTNGEETKMSKGLKYYWECPTIFCAGVCFKYGHFIPLLSTWWSSAMRSTVQEVNEYYKFVFQKVKP